MLTNLSFSRFKAFFQVKGPLRFELPPYSGSTFRGALGHTMQEVRYGMKRDCPECPVRSDCRYGNLYAYFFEAPADHPFISENARLIGRNNKYFPQPFILDPPSGGEYFTDELLTLEFTLVGLAIKYFPFMVCSMERLGRRRIGRKGGSIDLAAIVDGAFSGDENQALIYNGRTRRIEGPAQVFDFEIVRKWMNECLPEANGASDLLIRFLTPFRFKFENRLCSELTFPVFMKNVFRRLLLLSVHSPISSDIDYTDILDKSETAEVKTSRLKWIDWERYSDRQKGKMKLGGVVGEIIFSGVTDKFLPYIRMCEFLNIGKGGTFGLGKYESVLISLGQFPAACGVPVRLGI